MYSSGLNSSYLNSILGIRGVQPTPRLFKIELYAAFKGDLSIYKLQESLSVCLLFAYLSNR